MTAGPQLDPERLADLARTMDAASMDGGAHIREAARLITPGEYDESGDEALLARDIALAQVHASLAISDFLGDIAQELTLIRKILDATMGD